MYGLLIPVNELGRGGVLRPTRRDLIRGVPGTLIGASLLGQVMQVREAQAAWPFWLKLLGDAALVGGIGWLVGEALEWTVEQVEDFVRSTKVVSPPQARGASTQDVKEVFHESFAAPPVDATVPRVFAPKYGVSVEVKGKARGHPSNEGIPVIKDLNVPELKRMCIENGRDRSTLWVPCSTRSQPDEVSREEFARLCSDDAIHDSNGERVGADELELKYTRPFNNGKGTQLKSFAVASRTSPHRYDLIIPVA